MHSMFIKQTATDLFLIDTHLSKIKDFHSLASFSSHAVFKSLSRLTI